MASQEYTYTGGWETFEVPEGVTSMTVSLDGAGSGGVRGGHVEGTLAVTPGQIYFVGCGAPGIPNDHANGGYATFGGGGAGGRGKTGNGGDSGGGATVIRLSSPSGSLKALAGGAGGRSGDDGKGGEGGSGTGASGRTGTHGGPHPGTITEAKGGTQSTGGGYGTSTAGSSFSGWGGGHAAGKREPGNGIHQPGGEGASPAPDAVDGGGGGGGGYHSGGGGCGSRIGTHPGGGGGGGSNYTGGLTAAKSERGTGQSAGGAIEFKWGTPPPTHQPPEPPTGVVINGQEGEDAVATMSTGTVKIDATLNDPNPEDLVKMRLRLSPTKDFATYIDVDSLFYGNGQVAHITLTGLSQDTNYFARLWAIDSTGRVSEEFNSINFWTNRGPTMPDTGTAENANFPIESAINFGWTFEDPDDGDKQTGFEFSWRTAGTLDQQAGPWNTVAVEMVPPPAGVIPDDPSYTTPPYAFKGSTYYEWRVRNKDLAGRWSEWSFNQSFYVIGTTIPPTLVTPVHDLAADVSGDLLFRWVFNGGAPGETQVRADLRYRLVGQTDDDWIVRTGDTEPGVPGADQFWNFPPETFAPAYHYEWQVRTYDSVSGVPSDWSAAGTFWSILTPGYAISDRPVVSNPAIQGSLGCGTYRVFVYDQGGQTPRGEIDPLSALTFSRLRDDISSCLVTTNGFSADCCAMYRDLRSWAHEIVVFRDGNRVWEGPITRIGYQADSVEIEAKDVMAYLYRRIMRQGFNDSFQMVDPITREPVFSGGVQLGLSTVVQRALSIAVNALAPYDPNVLPHITALQHFDDARQSRVVEDYTQTAWEQIDDMAATAGLDYTVIGRRIIMWDTHRAIGRLPEMHDGDFSSPPVVTEYGMQLCNYGAVTNGSGVWGAARPIQEPSPFIYYGPIEMLASPYDEASAATDDTLTSQARQALVDVLTEQAQRNLAGRWPTPVVVRVPDNSTLNPNVGVGFEQLVPGVWIPLRSMGTCREVAQWQKLDSVAVTVGPDGEQVQVVMSPAPNAGEDPDAAQAAADAAG